MNASFVAACNMNWRLQTRPMIVGLRLASGQSPYPVADGQTQDGFIHGATARSQVIEDGAITPKLGRLDINATGSERAHGHTRKRMNLVAINNTGHRLLVTAGCKGGPFRIRLARWKEAGVGIVNSRQCRRIAADERADRRDTEAESRATKKIPAAGCGRDAVEVGGVHGVVTFLMEDLTEAACVR